MNTNPYVVLTLDLFRAELSRARAAGDLDRAAAYEAAIRSLLGDSDVRPELGWSPAAAGAIAN